MHSTAQPLPVVLSIAGSDSGGGAGVQADLRTFSALQVHGVFAVTALTAQNTQEVRHVQVASCESVREQMRAVYDDFPVAAVKTGMLASKEIVETVAASLAEMNSAPLVVDPVLCAQSRGVLLPLDALNTLKSLLFPLATLVTPNLPEVEALLGRSVHLGMQELEIAARQLMEFGPKAVLIKGGHTGGERADDILFDGEEFRVFSAPRVATTSTHGTGCTLSSAIAAHLARGFKLDEAVGQAKEFVTEALKSASPLGHGHGPLHHFHEFYPSRPLSRGDSRGKGSRRGKGRW